MAGTRLGLKTITFACDDITLFFPTDIELPKIEVLVRLPLVRKLMLRIVQF